MSVSEFERGRWISLFFSVISSHQRNSTHFQSWPSHYRMEILRNIFSLFLFSFHLCIEFSFCFPFSLLVSHFSRQFWTGKLLQWGEWTGFSLFFLKKILWSMCIINGFFEMCPFFFAFFSLHSSLNISLALLSDVFVHHRLFSCRNHPRSALTLSVSFLLFDFHLDCYPFYLNFVIPLISTLFFSLSLFRFS